MPRGWQTRVHLSCVVEGMLVILLDQHPESLTHSAASQCESAARAQQPQRRHATSPVHAVAPLVV